ncbi:MAG TPA: hypothetical protein VMI56_22625 [Reyranella sp.]|nr:hypothetical protein [Reyranella sp.]
MSLLGWTNIASAVLLALALAFGFYERSGWQGEIAARAQDVAAAEKAVADAAIADQSRTRQLEDQHAAEIARLKENQIARDTAIAAQPATTACAQSPAMRALFDGLRSRPGTAGAGPAGGAGRTRAALSR